MSDARTVIAGCLQRDYDTQYSGSRAEDFLQPADAILAALAEAGFVLMKADAVTKHKAWCPALSQCECEGSE